MEFTKDIQIIANIKEVWFAIVYGIANVPNVGQVPKKKLFRIVLGAESWGLTNKNLLQKLELQPVHHSVGQLNQKKQKGICL